MSTEQRNADEPHDAGFTVAIVMSRTTYNRISQAGRWPEGQKPAGPFPIPTRIVPGVPEGIVTAFGSTEHLREYMALRAKGYGHDEAIVALLVAEEAENGQPPMGVTAENILKAKYRFAGDPLPRPLEHTDREPPRAETEETP